MTGAELKAIRMRLGLTRVAFARSLGYEGSDDNNHTLIKRIEQGKRDVTPLKALRAIELDQAGTTDMAKER